MEEEIEREWEDDEIQNESVEEEEDFLVLNKPELETVLTHKEACECLHTLGKIDSGFGYAYLGLNASNKLLTDIGVIPTFKHVIFVNVSGNNLKSESLQVLEKMTYLLMLQADNCKLNSIILKPMAHLQVLTLNKNKLSNTFGIEHPTLERLELQRNKISTVTLNASGLKRLQFLDLSFNKLESTYGISCPNLTHVYLAGNKIKKIEGLGTLVNLRVLHLRNNRISNLDGFTSNCPLKYLNLRKNRIDKISEIEKLNCLSSLEVLLLMQNPLAELEETQEDSTYRLKILSMLINLKRIDKDPVLNQERTEARDLLNESDTRDNNSLDE
ncbi:leucine-rich repeat-containing protein 23-like [Prorops nasuta]|uniref:leucine-rich repeat-containing protein 23-like n=1 Tax=Prorops nasuta TaxID=863751 RepID=UPI0034CF435E